jgi:hypothetical protein
VRESFLVASFRYLRCIQCGTLQLDAPPVREGLEKLYQGDNTWTSSKDTALDDPTQLERVARQHLRLLGRIGANLARVFELGPGRGYLARALVDRGSSVTAFELHSETNEGLRQFGINTIADINALQGEYDTVILWGVIEHLADPFSMLSVLRERLAPGGSFVIFTEDSASWLAKVSGGRWTWLLPPEHIVLFSKSGIELCLGRLGFRLVTWRRWPADVRAILATLLGRARALRMRQGFRSARRASHSNGVADRRTRLSMIKRMLDTKLWPLSEHKVYRFDRVGLTPRL